MTTLTRSATIPATPPIGRFLLWAWRTSPLLTLAIGVHVALIPLVLLAWVLDPKTILGAPAWVKPLKFAVSISIYGATFLWLLSYVQGYARWRKAAANITAVTLTIEGILITMQVIRGTTSHFNVATAFDSAVFGIMGTSIFVAMMMNVLLASGLLLQRLPDRIFAWGLRMGVLISLIGMGIGPLMTISPTPSQLQRMQAGEQVITIGGHSVGVEDGGPGLPLVGWSTEGGDLRIPHFVGLHGMQLLPAVGWLLTRRTLQRRLPTGHRLLLLWITAAGYLGLVALLTWQALRGQSIIAPDALTLGTLTGLVGAFILVTGATWWLGARATKSAAS